VRRVCNSARPERGFVFRLLERPQIIKEKYDENR
jgi:hypothetical protein